MARFVAHIELEAETIDHALATLAAHFATTIAELEAESGDVGDVLQAEVRKAPDG